MRSRLVVLLFTLHSVHAHPERALAALNEDVDALSQLLQHKEPAGLERVAATEQEIRDAGEEGSEYAAYLVQGVSQEGGMAKAGDAPDFSLLGSGEEGSVYRVATEAGRNVAVKVRNDADTAEAIIAETMAGLGVGPATRHIVFTSPHPDDGWIGEKCVITMDLMHDNLDDGFGAIQALSADDKATFVQALVNKMNTMHRANHAHGDIKDANIMFGEVDGTKIPYLIDFGSATQLGEDGEAQALKDQDIESMKSLVRTFGSNDEEKAALEAIVAG